MSRTLLAFTIAEKHRLKLKGTAGARRGDDTVCDGQTEIEDCRGFDAMRLKRKVYFKKNNNVNIFFLKSIVYGYEILSI